ncbi:HAD hydrolase-like protein [Streptococcus sinensis]
MKILDHYNATPSDAIFFGDSDADIISAKKANVLAVGVN